MKFGKKITIFCIILANYRNKFSSCMQIIKHFKKKKKKKKKKKGNFLNKKNSKLIDFLIKPGLTHK